MNRDTLEGNWKKLKGEINSKWGKLTNDDVDTIDGEYDKLVGRLQERYGINREKARQEVEQWNVPMSEAR